MKQNFIYIVNLYFSQKYTIIKNCLMVKIKYKKVENFKTPYALWLLAPRIKKIYISLIKYFLI